MPRMTAIGAAVGALVGALALSGCSNPQSCAAVGFVDGAQIVLAGDTSSVTAVEVCASASCSFARGPTASPAVPYGFASSQSAVPAFAGRANSHGWFVGFSGKRPDGATVLVRGRAGVVLVRKTFALHWKQVGATSVCGNAHRVAPLHLLLPSSAP